MDQVSLCIMKLWNICLQKMVYPLYSDRLTFKNISSPPGNLAGRVELFGHAINQACVPHFKNNTELTPNTTKPMLG